MNNFYFGAESQRMMSEEDHMQSRPSALPSDTVVAMAYVPMQFYDQIFEVEEGFSCGTVFPELSKPFFGSDMR